MQEAETAEDLHFLVDVPVHFGVHSVAIECKSAGGKIVVLEPRQIRLRPQAEELLGDLAALGEFIRLCGMMFAQVGLLAELQRESPGAVRGSLCEGSASVVPERSEYGL